MRPSLLLTPRARRRPDGLRGDRRRRRGSGRDDATGVARETATATVRAAEIAHNQSQTTAPVADAAAQRVRDAGGPLDEATYACHCGCMFAAAVTTSVACPHCGGAQAW